MNDNEIKWKLLYDSLSPQVGILEARLKEVLAENNVLKAEKKHWLIEKAIQQQIIQEALNRANVLSNQYLEANQKLQEELLRLKNGNID